MAWTQKKVEDLKAGAKTRWLQENNLCIKVDPSGHIAYYCDLDRKKHHLGNHPLITLRQARKKKDLLYNDHYMGKTEVTKQTFAEFVRGKDFVDWSKGSRTTHEARMASMERTILPILGKVKLAKLDQADITRYKNARRATGVRQGAREHLYLRHGRYSRRPPPVPLRAELEGVKFQSIPRKPTNAPIAKNSTERSLADSSKIVDTVVLGS